MLKGKIFLILALHLCGEISANSIYRGNHGWHQQQAMQDFANYHQKLQHQGFAPVSSFNPPFILHNNANHLGIQYGPAPPPAYPHHKQHPYPCKHKTTPPPPPPTKHTTLTPTTKHTTPSTKKPHKGNFTEHLHNIKVDKVDAVVTLINNTIEKIHLKPSVQEKLTSLVDSSIAAILKPVETLKESTIEKLQKPIEKPQENKVVSAIKETVGSATQKIDDIKDKYVESLIKTPPFIDQVENKVQNLNDKIDNKTNAIREYIDNRVNAIGQLSGDILDKVSNRTANVFESINKRLESIEAKLKRGKPKSFDDENEEDFDMTRSLIDDEDEAEMRSVKNSVGEAVKKATEKFNRVIEDQVAKVNSKINEINDRVESVVGKLQAAVGKIVPTKPPTPITTTKAPIKWQPPTPTWTPSPELFKYTIPQSPYARADTETTDNVDADLNRMENLEIVDSSPASEVVESVRDTSDDKLSGDAVDVEAALGEELRNELQEQIDGNADDLTKTLLTDDEVEEEEEGEEEGEEELPSQLINIDDELRSEDEKNLEGIATDIPLNDGQEESEEGTATDIPLNGEEEDSNPQFDELEVIQLIPVIIEQLRLDRVSTAEEKSLESIFGNLWSLIKDEAARDVNGDEPMNPMLRTILNSEEVRLSKRDISAQIGNDIYKNSLRRVYRGGEQKQPYISLDDDRKLLSPAERLLNMVAVIVHKSNVAEKAQAKKLHNNSNKNKKKKAKRNPFGIVTMQKPKQRFVDRILSINNRMKRSLIKFGTDLAEMVMEEDDGVDTDDYMDDEDDIDYDYPALPTPQNNNNYNYDDDSWISQRRIYDDYEDGSVNEFINLAKQRDRREHTFDDDYVGDEEDYEENYYDN